MNQGEVDGLVLGDHRHGTGKVVVDGIGNVERGLVTLAESGDI